MGKKSEPSTEEEAAKLNIKKIASRGIWLELGSAHINTIIESLEMTGEVKLANSIREYVEECIEDALLHDQYRSACAEGYGMEIGERNRSEGMAIDDNCAVQPDDRGAWVQAWMYMEGEQDPDLPFEDPTIGE